MSNCILNENEIKTVKSCLYNIEDKMQAIIMEMSKDNPYKGYLSEKTKSALYDLNVILNICEREEK